MANSDDSGRTLGHFSGNLDDAQPVVASGKKKAIMFVPEGVDVKATDLEIEVVALDAATFEAMGPRRC